MFIPATSPRQPQFGMAILKEKPPNGRKGINYTTFSVPHDKTVFFATVPEMGQIEQHRSSLLTGRSQLEQLLKFQRQQTTVTDEKKRTQLERVLRKKHTSIDQEQRDFERLLKELARQAQ